MTQSMSEDLAKSIQDWVDSNPKRTLGTLSKLSGVSYPTVRRLAQGKGEPSLDVALGIASSVFDTEHCNEFLSKYFPSFSNWRRCHQTIEATPTFDEASPWLTEKDSALIIALASRDNGVKKSDIAKKLGDEGLKAAAELVENDVLQDAGETFHTTQKTFQVLNPKIVLNQIGLWATQIFDSSKLQENDQACYYFMYEGLNSDGINAINNETLEYAKAVSNIKNNPKYRGDILAFSAAYTNLVEVSGEEI